ncbi:sigma-70 family RNA polymerase sigma factor [Nitratireductor sp. ZSWI3]|uniref:sigma-70 family RNA polymerase sigma factor n=1 Tax=Nitratireductor sp. ZSWI3 TaxID=2966359 RepID=UPI0021502004|nr:sigma-70 family RNA polymerase sigma factor [Nitratireductor sp. ZSWI3]MCR4265090.1 sigma-70 family RNA polymerase sigma factor [Nitratireductor sp. ZSWI3]
MGQSSDRVFFRTEIERLMDRLYGTALRLTRNRADAEDLVAETVMKAWAHFGQLADRRCFHKWLLRILVNTFVSNQRHLHADMFEALDPDDEACQFSLFEKMHQPFLLWWSNPEQELVSKMLREDIEAAIDAIPTAFRTVLVMVEINGQSYAEAAEALALPVGTVRSRLSRARCLLQKALWEQAREAGLTLERPAGTAHSNDKRTKVR